VGVYQDDGKLSVLCTPNVSPPRRNIVAERRMSAKEVDALENLVHESHLYDGGNTGFGPPGSEGPWETLTVHCCDRRDTIVLVTQGNAMFQSDHSRHELLQRLYAWQDELKKSAEQKLRR
jgi:hypothetical protein